MSGALRQIARLPWAFVVLFDIAAFTALVAVLLLLSVDPAKGDAAHVKRLPEKRIALSFDDSPRGRGAFLDHVKRPRLLIDNLTRARVKQAAFFVNPGRITAGDLNEANLLAFARSGHVLANHTANHLPLFSASPERFLADIDEAEIWLRKQKGYRPWFRFPALYEGGPNDKVRDAVRRGLKVRGLKNGYATIDGWDWKLDSLVRKAEDVGQKVNKKALRDLFIESHVEAAAFADRLAKRTLGRSPAHMLLLHDADITAMYLPDLVKALRDDGWTIITADEAYADPVYQSEPVVADAYGTLIEMLSWEKAVPGPRWFERNTDKVAIRLFNERVLRSE